MTCHLVPFEDDLVARCADAVIADCEAHLPDLSGAVILLPDEASRTAPQFAELRHCLLERAQRKNHAAIIPPAIATPHTLFIRRCAPGYSADLARHRERLVLAHALAEHPDLFPNQSPWQSSDALLSLFHEISDLDESGGYDEATLEQSLQGLEPGVWSDDSRMFLSLWRIWRDLIVGHDAHNLREMERRAFISGDLTAPGEHVYLCGIDRLSPCRLVWAKNLHARNRLTFLAQDAAGALRYPNPARETAAAVCGEAAAATAAGGDFTRFINAVFAGEGKSFSRRAQEFAGAHPHSPLSGRVRTFKPASLEQHTWGIYLAIKEWIKQGHRKIAVVALDRKLARRMRAAFDRYGLILQDYSGWELSTTSSATVLMQLLPDEKKPFGCGALIGLMRMPHCDFGVSRDRQMYAVHQVEKRLAALDQLPQTARELLAAMPDDDTGEARRIGAHVAAVMDKLQALSGQSKRPLSEYFDVLFAAMRELGISKRLAVDSAGRALLGELNNMRDAAGAEKLNGGFHFWRGWLVNGLEQCNYIPRTPQRGVLLMNPRQARLWRADALVLAALDDKHLPAFRPSLMNENIRRELKLETREQQQAHQFLSFRILLESAGKVLLTCQEQSNGRPLAPSPWLDAILNFHQLAYRDDLTDHAIAEQARQCQTQAVRQNPESAPAVQTMPAPGAPRNRWPQSLSASAHQTMMKCPYRFFVEHGLGLRAHGRPGEYWDKRAFGSHLHRCLHALHEDVDGQPGPMDKPWTKDNRRHALSVAAQIINARFKPAVAKNYANYYWLHLAQTAVERYMDWLIELADEHGGIATRSETAEEKIVAEGLVLKGKIDLVIKTGGGRLIVDYKTGMLPPKKAMETGEDVQLACYALLEEGAGRVLYLAFAGEDAPAIRKHEINGERLSDCRNKARQRLSDIYDDYMSGRRLPAWGGEKDACRYCNWEGVCRRPAWREADVHPAQPGHAAHAGNQ